MWITRPHFRSFMPGHKRAGQRHARAEVELEKLVPEIVGELIDRLGLVGAGVVDEDVDLAHCRDRLGGEPGGIFSTGEVGDDVPDLDCEPGGDVAAGGFELILVPAGDDDIGTGLGEPAGHGFAETLAAAGYQGHAAGKIEQALNHGVFLVEDVGNSWNYRRDAMLLPTQRRADSGGLPDEPQRHAVLSKAGVIGVRLLPLVACGQVRADSDDDDLRRENDGRDHDQRQKTPGIDPDTEE